MKIEMENLGGSLWIRKETLYKVLLTEIPFGLLLDVVSPFPTSDPPKLSECSHYPYHSYSIKKSVYDGINYLVQKGPRKVDKFPVQSLEPTPR